MASSVQYPLPENLAKTVTESKVLVVGAGGIGCELLKNLVLTGFQEIVVVKLVATPASSRPTSSRPVSVLNCYARPIVYCVSLT